ncbi:hypothetical protein MMC26_001484 [Xylographa opegraphella]|nr:hypothetical protein [Xylographa opegraphella]
MYFSTTALFLGATASLSFAAPLLSRDSTVYEYGSMGFVTMMGFSGEAGAATCDSKAPKPDGPSVRLPAAYMAGNANCGKKVTIFYAPVNNAGPGLAPASSLTSVEAVIYGTCVKCETWQAEASSDLFDMIDSGGNPVKGTWGPAIVMGTP